MAKKQATRGAQWAHTAEFYFNPTDTIKDVNGALKNFADVGTTVADVILLPVNATVTHGELVVETALTGPTAYTISVGDVNNTTRYLGATSSLTAGRTPLVPTGYVGAGENIRITVAGTVAPATAGKICLRVSYVIRDKMDVAQTQ